jgi:hypothetical protein
VPTVINHEIPKIFLTVHTQTKQNEHRKTFVSTVPTPSLKIIKKTVVFQQFCVKLYALWKKTILEQMRQMLLPHYCRTTTKYVPKFHSYQRIWFSPDQSLFHVKNFTRGSLRIKIRSPISMIKRLF